MLNSLRALEQIQRIDLEINAVGEEEKRLNREIEGTAAELKAAEEVINKINAEVGELDKTLMEAEEKIRQSSDKIGKDEKRINDIRNEKELNALTKEINTANKTRKQQEQEKASLNSKLSEKKALLEEKRSGLNDKNARLGDLTREFEGKKVGWKESIDRNQQLRDSVKHYIRPDILKRYETVRSKRGGLAMVPVRDETCQGCFIHIPPQVYIQLKKGSEELISCPHCHRILYVEETNRSEAAV